MSMKVNQLMQEKAKAARDTLDRLRFNAPSVWQALQQAMQAKKKRAGLSGLGDFSWTDLLDLGTTVAASRTISSDERKAANIELQALREKNATIEKQIKLQTQLEDSKNRGMTLAQQAGTAGSSVMDQLADKPWALPALLGLGFALFRSISSRRR